jgi:hypothetical protein
VEQAALLEVGRQACLLVAAAHSAEGAGTAAAMEASRMDFVCRSDVSAYDLW